MARGEETEEVLPWASGSLRELLAEQWDRLLAGRAQVRHRARDVLLEQGRPGDHVLLLTGGLVKVARLAADGSQVLLAVRGPGELLGEMAVIDRSRPRTATVTTLRASTTVRFEADEFREAVAAMGLGDRIAQHAVIRHRQSEQLHVELATLSVERRLIRLLRRMAQLARAAGEDEGRIDLGMTQQELAEAVGASRSRVAAVLARLRARGVIDTSRQRITVLTRRRAPGE